MKLNENQVLKIDYKIDLSNDRSVVMIDVMGDKSISSFEKISNVYCIDKKNNIIWQVKEIGTKVPFDDDGFVYLKKNEIGEIIADRFSGFIYKINPETGEATQIGFEK